MSPPAYRAFGYSLASIARVAAGIQRPYQRRFPKHQSEPPTGERSTAGDEGGSAKPLLRQSDCGTIELFSEPSGAKEHPTIHAPQAGRVRGEIRAPPVFGKGNRPTPNTGRHFCCRLACERVGSLRKPGKS